MNILNDCFVPDRTSILTASITIIDSNVNTDSLDPESIAISVGPNGKVIGGILPSCVLVHTAHPFYIKSKLGDGCFTITVGSLRAMLNSVDAGQFVSSTIEFATQPTKLTHIFGWSYDAERMFAFARANAAPSADLWAALPMVYEGASMIALVRFPGSASPLAQALGSPGADVHAASSLVRTLLRPLTRAAAVVAGATEDEAEGQWRRFPLSLPTMPALGNLSLR